MNSSTISHKDKDLKNFRKAVHETILNNHARGLPAYQREGDYIIALYPNGHKFQLEMVGNPQREKALWYHLR
jgi:hypothetical protein